MCYTMIITYIIIQLIGLFFMRYLNVQSGSLILTFAIQMIAALYISNKVNKFYGWKNIGFGNIQKQNLFWFLPYVIIIGNMSYTFLVSIYQNSSKYDISIWFSLFFILIGTILSGFCEEILFRGILLNTYKKQNSLIQGMIFSSIGFSIFHITVVFVGKSFFSAIFNVIYASLLGFAFVALTLKINNILPLIIYHCLWNYILIASEMLNISLSKASYYNNILNIIISIILWIYILYKEKSKKKLIFSR